MAEATAAVPVHDLALAVSHGHHEAAVAQVREAAVAVLQIQFTT